MEPQIRSGAPRSEELAIKDYLRVYTFGDDGLQFGVFPENQTILGDPTGITRTILEKSFAGKPFSRVCRELRESGYTPDVIEESVRQLRERGILQETGLRRADRYERQRRYFEIFKDNFLPGAFYQDQLAASRVVLLGLGAVGSQLSQLLVTAGVARVVGIDDGSVGAQDIRHQHLYDQSCLGRRRAGVWSEIAGALNPDCTVETCAGLDDLAALGADSTSLCLATDPRQFAAADVAAACEAARMPYLLFGIDGERGIIEPIFLPRRGPCPKCVESPLLTPRPTELDAAQTALLTSSLGSLAALQALKFLSGSTSPNNLSDRLVVDLGSFGIGREEVPETRCESCSPHLAERAATFAALESGSSESPKPESCDEEHAVAAGEDEVILSGAADFDSRLEFHPLVESLDQDGVILGREATGTFLSMGESERKFLRLLEQGMPIRRARRAFGELFGIPDLKVGSFIKTLAESGFIKKVDGEPLEKEPQQKTFHFTWIKPQHAALFFSRPALLFYGAMMLTAIGLCIADPSYLPHYRHVYFLPSISLSLLINTLVGWLMLPPHEMLHLLAAKSVGAQSGMSLGHRLVFVVVQTDVTNIWKVARRRRYRVYLAGMISEAMIASTVILSLFAHDRGWVAMHPYFESFLRAVLWIATFKIAWNFLFYMRTDIYYFLANLFECKNLYQDTVHFLRNELAREIPWIRPVATDPIPEREQRFVQIYAILFLLGTIFTMAAFSIAILPLALVFRNAILSGISGGFSGQEVRFIDSAVAAGLIFFELGLLAWAMVSNRKKKRLVTR